MWAFLLSTGIGLLEMFIGRWLSGCWYHVGANCPTNCGQRWRKIQDPNMWFLNISMECGVVWIIMLFLWPASANPDLQSFLLLNCQSTRGSGLVIGG
jgi:hypothetical protein